MNKSATGKLRNYIPSKGNNKCKGPGVGKSPACLRNREEPSVTEAERMVWEEVGEAGRGQVTQGLKALTGLDFSPTALGSH